jgi:hypothetical protein
MAERVISASEVNINGEFYRLLKTVQTTSASQYPPKRITGDIDQDSQERLSVVRWSSSRGGVGKKDIENPDDVKRIWYGTSWLRVDGHKTLPPAYTTTAPSGISGVFSVGAMAELDSTIYAAFGTTVMSYAPNTWTSVDTLGGNATDAIATRLGGTVYIVFAYASGYVDSTDGSSWNTRTTDVKYMAAWDDRLWGIDNTGQLRWAFDPTGTWTDDAELPLPDGYVQDLFVGRDAGGEHILYASTQVGLFAHDIANSRFVLTELDFPFHEDAGAGVSRWRDSTYVPAGLGIYSYQVGGGGAVISVMGPDRDQGLPANRRGKIVRLEKSHNDLIALIDDTSSAAEDFDMFASSGFGGHMPTIVGPAATGRSLIMAWDTEGWQVLWESGSNEQEISYSLVSNAYNEYRLWWAQNELVHYLPLPVDVVNPDQMSDREYADSSRDEYSWFDAGQAEINKLAVRLHVEAASTSSSETIIPYYGIDYDDNTWTTLSTVTSDGISTYTFPNATAGTTTSATGTAFRAIRFRIDMVNGSDNSLSPDLRSLTLEYRKKLPAKFRWVVELDLQRSYKGNSPKTQRANVLSAIQSNTRVEFTFRDDTGDTRNYFVDVVPLSEIEETGHSEKGATRLALVEL